MKPVPNIVDGDYANAASMLPTINMINANFAALEDRMAAWSNKAALWTNGLAVANDVAVGDVVAYSGTELVKAERKFGTSYNNIVAGTESFTLGIVDTVDGATASVFLSGVISKADIVETLTGSSATTGPLFLGTAGKLTANPSGLLIFVGIAVDPDTFILNPSPDSMNSLYSTFRFDIPALVGGVPTYATGAWTIAKATTPLGWIAAADSEFAAVADGANWFYQLPASTLVDAADIQAAFPFLSTALKEAELIVALREAIGPFRPDMQALLFNNGVSLGHRTDSYKGCWRLDEYGLWWYGTGRTEVPWDPDINRVFYVVGSNGSATLSVKRYDDAFYTSKFQSAASAPYTSYLVAGAIPDDTAGVVGTLGTNPLTPSSVTDAANGLSATLTFSSTITTAPTNCYWKWRPEFAGSYIGSDATDLIRGRKATTPKFLLQFTKTNPSIKDLAVTSLRYDSTAPATNYSYPIELVGTQGDSQVKGDLKLRFKLPLEVSATTVAASTAIKDLLWDATKLTISKTPIVSSVVGANGVSVNTDSSGVATVSYDGGNQNLITMLEPENTDLEFKGLNSYLVFKQQACGVVGKFLLPSAIPAGKRVRINAYGFKNSGNGGNPSFTFYYNQPLLTNGKIDTSTTTGVAQLAASIPTAAAMGRLFTTESMIIASPVGGAVVNFRLSKAVEAPNAVLICIVAFNWEFIT